MEDILENGPRPGARPRWLRTAALLAAVVTVALILRYAHDEPAGAAPGPTTRASGAAAVPTTADAAALALARARANLPLAAEGLRDWSADKAFALAVDTTGGPDQAEEWDARWDGWYTAAVACVGQGSVVVAVGRTREATHDLDAGVRVPCAEHPGPLVFTDVHLHLGCLCARVIPAADTAAAVAIAVRPRVS
jgi:hypothetical protein